MTHLLFWSLRQTKAVEGPPAGEGRGPDAQPRGLSLCKALTAHPSTPLPYHSLPGPHSASSLPKCLLPNFTHVMPVRKGFFA